MTPIERAIAASSRITEARIEIGKLQRAEAEQHKIINLAHAEVDTFLALIRDGAIAAEGSPF